MSEPVTSSDIEDVLASIRRLIASDESTPGEAAANGHHGPSGEARGLSRLILTEAHLVAPPVAGAPGSGDTRERGPETSADTAPRAAAQGPAADRPAEANGNDPDEAGASRAGPDEAGADQARPDQAGPAEAGAVEREARRAAMDARGDDGPEAPMAVNVAPEAPAPGATVTRLAPLPPRFGHLREVLADVPADDYEPEGVEVTPEARASGDVAPWPESEIDESPPEHAGQGDEPPAAAIDADARSAAVDDDVARRDGAAEGGAGAGADAAGRASGEVGSMAGAGESVAAGSAGDSGEEESPPLMFTHAGSRPATGAQGARHEDGAGDAEPVPGDAGARGQARSAEDMSRSATRAPDGAPAEDDDDDFVLELREDVLREIVAELVREELRGELGARITRNVRKFVRNEVHRILASRELG